MLENHPKSESALATLFLNNPSRWRLRSRVLSTVSCQNISRLAFFYTQLRKMRENVCRTCFTELKTKHYVALNNKSEIPGYETVQDALAELLPNLVEHVKFDD